MHNASLLELSSVYDGEGGLFAQLEKRHTQCLAPLGHYKEA